MSAGYDQDKTEPASPKKREEARRKGQVALSREIPSVLVLLGALSFFHFGGGWMFSRFSGIMVSILSQCGRKSLEAASLHLFMWDVFSWVLMMMAPLMLVIGFSGVLGNVSQIGFMISTEAMAPKLAKLNPIKGFSRFLSLRSLVELTKSIVKMAIVGIVAYVTLRSEMDRIPSLLGQDISDIFAFAGSAALKIGFYTCLILLVPAGLDYIFQRWQHERDLRMTKQEVKDEFRQREGDPLIRSRIRSAQRELAMKRMMQAVPKATVVITNPTHLAVALRFENSMAAPVVVAKGAGLIAERIREIARKHGVTIIEQKPLARALYKTVEVDRAIPPELYHAVAEILAYVYRLKGYVR